MEFNKILPSPQIFINENYGHHYKNSGIHSSKGIKASFE
jgi:hypothetical protein